MANVLYGANLTDEATCYKVFSAKVLHTLRLNSRRFDLCPEFSAKVRKLGYRIHEVPVSYSARPYPYGKKVSWWDGFR